MWDEAKAPIGNPHRHGDRVTDDSFEVIMDNFLSLLFPTGIVVSTKATKRLLAAWLLSKAKATVRIPAGSTVETHSVITAESTPGRIIRLADLVTHLVERIPVLSSSDKVLVLRGETYQTQRISTHHRSTSQRILSLLHQRVIFLSQGKVSTVILFVPWLPGV